MDPVHVFLRHIAFFTKNKTNREYVSKNINVSSVERFRITILKAITRLSMTDAFAP